jgi:hypothetical protein
MAHGTSSCCEMLSFLLVVFGTHVLSRSMETAIYSGVHVCSIGRIKPMEIYLVVGAISFDDVCVKHRGDKCVRETICSWRSMWNHHMLGFCESFHLALSSYAGC